MGGAYFFGDNEKVSLGKRFWDLSPGIEWMTPDWDIHVNGYFPTHQTEQMGSPVFADTLGNYDYVNFVSGTHNQYDALAVPYDVIGNGADVEMGYRFAAQDNLASRVYVGGYYYHPSNDFMSITNVKNTTGVTAGFEQSLNKNIRVSMMNSYDSVNFYTIGVGIQFAFGDESTLYSNNVHDRLLEPIERHVGVIETGAGTYDQLGYKNAGNALEYNNVYFMSPGGVGNGTYGSPMPLTQSSLDTINSGSPNSSRLYLQGGNAAIYNVNTTTAGTYNGLLLYNGQDLYGRSTNYTAPANRNKKPMISVDGASGVNGFIIHSGENTLDDLAITASSTNTTTIGIDVVTSTNATVNVVNTSVTALNTGLYAENDSAGSLTINATNASFNSNVNNYINLGAYGLEATNNSSGTLNITATNSSFNGNTNMSTDEGAYGLEAANNSSGTLNFTATNSSFNENVSNASNSHGAYGAYIVNNGSGNINITTVHSFFNENTSTGETGPGAATGMFAQGNLNLAITNSAFNGNTVMGQNNGGAYGMNVSGTNMNMTVTNSTFNGNINNAANNAAGSYSSGAIIFASGNTGAVNITNSQFNGNMVINGSGASAVCGLTAEGTGSVSMRMNITGSQFNRNTASGDNNGGAQGLDIANASSNPMTLNITNSQFNDNSASGNNNTGSVFGLWAGNLGDGAFTVNATHSQFNGNAASGSGVDATGFGFYVDNSAGNNTLSASLSGSTFFNNSTYGLFANGNTSSTIDTTINLFNTSFFGNPTNWGSSGNVTFKK